MKNAGFISFLLCICLSACGDNISANDVPSVVLNSFKSKFPNAMNIEWERADTHYEAEFETGSIDHAAQLTADGKLIMQKEDIEATNLPANISSLLKNKFRTYSTDQIERVEKDSFTYYQVELESIGKPEKKLVLSADQSENTSIPYWD
jgi:hypothetical protein